MAQLWKPGAGYCRILKTILFKEQGQNFNKTTQHLERSPTDKGTNTRTKKQANKKETDRKKARKEGN